ncbi:MAG: hypothetical protein ACOYI3_05705 [Christensenellales bacterium]|jgi:hypothetical protein
MSHKKLHIESAKASKLPLRFVKSRDAAGGGERFTARCNGKKLLFEKDRIAIFKSRPGESQEYCPCLALRFVNARESAPAGFLLHDVQLPCANCCETVPAYGMLKYADVWDGVDLELSACDEGLKMNWVLKTPAIVDSLRLSWEGATALELDEDGSLLIHSAHAILKDAAPKAWQVKNADMIPVDCAYRLAGGTEVIFELSADCDRDAPIVIDPLIS